jgi:hypothetical protein
MSRLEAKLDPVPRRRRYLVHLCCVYDESRRACRYIARTQLWKARNNVVVDTQEHAFADEYELIETINPLLPHGSDVRNVMSHVESPDGFLYLLHLNAEEAEHLGWRRSHNGEDYGHDEST